MRRIASDMQGAVALFIGECILGQVCMDAVDLEW